MKHPTNPDTITLCFQPRPDIRTDIELILIIFNKDSFYGEIIQTYGSTQYSGRIYIQKTETEVIPGKISLDCFGEYFVKNLDRNTIENILNDLNKSHEIQTNIKDIFTNYYLDLNSK